MAHQRNPARSHDSEIDIPAWLNYILPPLKQPQGRDLWCEACQSLPDAKIREICTGIGDFENETFSPKTSPDCALCKLVPAQFINYETPFRFSSIDLTQDPEPAGRVVIRETEVSRMSRDSLVFRGRRERFLASQDIPSSLNPSASTIPYPINLANLKTKLAHCCSDHGKCNRRSSATMDSIKLINCSNLAFETSGGGQAYAALSYVWGPTAPSCTTSTGKLVGDIERTIADAMLVAKEMGLNYLWVDRYCIDQDDHGKHEQIKQMDLVYYNATLTIVAAAGDDASYGLPGISSRRPDAVSSCRIGSHVLFRNNAVTSIARSIGSSRWSSRAWTFQEGLFSRRCLVFTDCGASFCCSEIDFCRGTETHHLRAAALTETELLGFSWASSGGRNDPGALRTTTRVTGFDHISRGSDAEINRLIQEYSRRTLTYASDILNGLYGTLRAYQAKEPPAYHFWGMPIGPADYTAEGFLQTMGWQLKKPGHRRLGFPSWSWVGWEGGIFFAGRRWGARHHPPRRPVQITVVLEGDERLDWSVFEQEEFLKDQHPDVFMPTMHLQAWTIEVMARETDTKKLCVEYEDRRGREYVSPLCIDDESLDTPEARAKLCYKRFVAVVLGSRPWTRGGLYSIVITEDSVGAAERFAVFELGKRMDGYTANAEGNLDDIDAVWRSIRLG